MKRRPVLVASVFLVVMVVAAFLVFDGIALGFFNFFMGNNVYALQVSYVPSVDGFGNAKVSFTLDLLQTRMPVETVLSGYSVRTDAVASFADANFSVCIYVFGETANRIQMYGHEFSFGDGEARTLTCYLRDYDAQKYSGLTASIWGYTVYNDLRTDFSGYGGSWTP